MKPLNDIPPVKEPWSDILLPQGYAIQDGELVQIDENAKITSQIAGPIWVSAHTRDSSDSHYGIVVKFIDLRGQLVEYAFPRDLLHEQGRSLVQALARRGCFITPGKESRLLQYLGRFETQHLPWLASTTKTGWLDTDDGHLAYIHPSTDTGVISVHQDERVIFQPEQYSPTLQSMRQQGTLADWQHHVAAPCSQNPYLISALCIGLSAPLLKAAAAESGGFHFYGRSSRGKTTSAQVAASLWGSGADPSDNPDQAYIQRWNATTNGLEAMLAAHNDSLLVLDEIHTCDARDFGRIVYNMAGGKGKTAMDKHRNLKPTRTWRAVVLSNGEISSRKKIEEEHKKAHAGQAVRLIDIPVSDTIIAHSHGQNASEFALQLKRACARYYGVAGAMFIQRLITRYEGYHLFAFDIKNQLSQAESRLCPGTLEPEQQRALRRFSLLLVAGELGVDFGILPFEKLEIEQSIKILIQAWLTENDHIPDHIRGCLAVQNFIQRNQSRFRLAGADSTTHDLAGFLENDAHMRKLFMFIPETFTHACGDYNYREVARELLRLRFLITNEHGRMTYKSSVSVNGASVRLRLYAISEKFLEFDFANQTHTARIEDGTSGTNGTAP